MADFSKPLKEGGTSDGGTVSGGSGDKFGQPLSSKKKKDDGGFLGGAKKAALGALDVVVTPLSAIQQAVYRTGAATGEAARAVAGKEGASFGGALSELGKGAAELATVGFGVEDIGLSEAMTPRQRRETGDIIQLPRGLETLGNVVLDPANLVTFGATAAGKQAVRQVADVAATRYADEALEGFRTLNNETFNKVSKGLSREELARQEGRRRVREFEQRLIKGQATDADRQLVQESVQTIRSQAGDRVADRTLGRITRGVDETLRLPAAVKESRIAEGIRSGRQALGETGAGALVRRAFRPGEAVRDVFRRKGEAGAVKADEMAERFLDLKSERVGYAQKLVKQSADQIQEAIGRAGGEISKVDNELFDEVLTHINAARIAEEPMAKTLADASNWLALNNPVAHDLLTQMTKMRATFEARLKSLAPNVAPGKKAEWLAEQMKAVDERLFGTAREEVGTLKRLTGKEGAEAAEHVGARRLFKNLESAINRVENVAFVQKVVRDIRDDAGSAVFSRSPRKGWIQIEDPAIGRIWVADRHIADEVKDFLPKVYNNVAMEVITRTSDAVGNVWRQMATIFPPGFVGFVSRNARGNFALNSAQGLTDPRWYARAMEYQKATTKGATGIQARILQEAFDRNVLDQGFFDLEVVRNQLDRIKVEGDKIGLAKKTGKVLTAPGMKVNQLVESNARMASFLFNMERFGATDDVVRRAIGGDTEAQRLLTNAADQSARATKKYLFDYAELTPTERQLFRRVVPFYTFMRKNTALWVGAIAREPRQLLARERIAEGVFGETPEDAPEYAQRLNALKTPPPLSALLGGGTSFIRPESPVRAAVGQLQPLVSAVAEVAGEIPGVKEKAIVKALQSDSGAIAPMREFINLFGGPGPEAVKSAFEITTGKSTFTGRQLSPSERNVLRNFIEKQLPPVARTEGILERITSDDESTRKKAISELLNTLGGVRVTEVD